MASRAKAIREKCIDCCCGDKKEVRLCPVIDCPLHKFRLGREIRSENATKSDEIEDGEYEGV